MTDKVVIVQPSVPSYRRRFFDRVAERLNAVIVASDVSIDGARSEIKGMSANVRLLPVSFLAGKVAWQSGLVGMVRREKMRAIVLSGNPRYLSTLIALAVAKFRRIPVYWWGHALSSSSRGVGPRIRMWLMRSADRLLLYYPEEKQLLPQHLRRKSSALNNTIDTGAILAARKAMSQEDIQAHRQEFGLDERPLFVAIGRLTAKSETQLLVDAFASLRKKNVEARLAVLGDGPQLEGLQSRADALGVSKDIVWAGAVYDEASIALWMSAATAFVYAGAVGLSLIHAFAYGVPAIIRSGVEGHNPEARVFESGQHGLVFPGGDSDALADRLAEFVEFPERAMQMGESALELVERRLTIEHMVDNFCTALKDERS